MKHRAKEQMAQDRKAFPLICPSCAAPLGSGWAVCAGCQRTTPLRDGVWDYVQQDRATQLEDLDYVIHYAIDDAKIDATFRAVHQSRDCAR